MALASPALFLIYFYTHSLRCGLEECCQLRWLCPKNHTVRALAIAAPSAQRSARFGMQSG